MTNFKEAAENYVPNKLLNIAELEAVSIKAEVKSEDRVNSEGETYKISYIVVDGIEHRVPKTVLEQVKNVLLEKPDLKTFKVTKSGKGLNTKYQVITLE